MIIPREIYQKIKPVIGSSEAIIITGMRRTGKTTLLRFISDHIRSENKIFLDLENPVNQKYFQEENYDKVADNLNFLGLNAKQKSYVFLDEIQFVKNIPSVIKYLADHYKIKFFLSGSASFYLKNLFSESLSGRKYLFELFPLDFEEFLWMKNIARAPSRAPGISRARHQTWQRHYAEYVAWGGFPAVVLKRTKEEKRRTLEDIFTSYFNKEVGQLGDFKNNRNVRDLILLLLARVGSKLDVQKLSVELGISRATVKDYLAFLEGTYMV